MDKIKQNLNEIYPEEVAQVIEIKEKPKVVLVMGGPGSGKGTQCKLLKQAYPDIIFHLSIGDVLREERQQETYQGKIINAYVTEFEKTGKLMPLEITFNLLLQTMIKSGWNKKVYLVDGFIKDFSILKKFNQYIIPLIDLKFVLYYQCSILTMKNRVLKRAETSDRKDDNEIVFKHRIETFEKRTLPAVSYFMEQDLLEPIDGEQDFKIIQKETRELFEQKVLK